MKYNRNAPPCASPGDPKYQSHGLYLKDLVNKLSGERIQLTFVIGDSKYHAVFSIIQTEIVIYFDDIISISC
jgi:hypothetical protein